LHLSFSCGKLIVLEKPTVQASNRDIEMTGSTSDKMVSRLRDMQTAASDIIASSVVSVDGLTIASALPGDVEEDRVAAMSAAMLSLGERIAGELGRGVLDEVYIRGEAGFVLLTAVGQEAVLTALAREEAKLGMIFLEMRRAAEDLEKMVG
jgi:hypothetical protein